VIELRPQRELSYRGLSYNEIAEELGQALGTAHPLSRACKRLNNKRLRDEARDALIANYLIANQHSVQFGVGFA
jgi:orotate phosphoribosyltransferase-like protein